MNAAHGLAIVAALLQLNDAPDVAPAIEMLTPYFPDAAYIGAAAIADELTYTAGLDWRLGTRWGTAAEYRHWPAQITFAGNTHRVTTHGATAILYRELPAWNRLTLRTEAGGAILWQDAAGLDTSSTWAIGIRGVGRMQLTVRISIQAWIGSLRIGSSSATNGQLKGISPRSEFIETGAALRIAFPGEGVR